MFPIFLLLFTGVLDLGRMMLVHMRVGQILDDAAQYATTRRPTTGEYPGETHVRERIEARMVAELPWTTYVLSARFDATLEGESAVHLLMETHIQHQGFLPLPSGRSALTVRTQVWQPRL